MNVTKNQSFQILRGDITLEAVIDPCSWMYQSYGLQLSVKLPEGGSAKVSNRQLPFDTATTQDVLSLLEPVKIKPCTTCMAPAFDADTVQTNRAGLCEKCFMAKINAEFEAETEVEKKKIAKLDTKYKAEGFTHRVDAWIHPSSGDDYQITFWMQNPTAKAIQGQLRKKRSTVLTDYKLVVL